MWKDKAFVSVFIKKRLNLSQRKSILILFNVFAFRVNIL